MGRGNPVSHYNNIETQIKDLDALLNALCRVNTRTHQWTRNTIEVHKTPQHLMGYQGDTREQTAEIIIRQRHVGGASNDIGFKKQADGTYTAIISDYDQGFYNTQWVQSLGTYYGVEATKNACRAQGVVFTETIDEKNRPVIRCHVPG